MTLFVLNFRTVWINIYSQLQKPRDVRIYMLVPMILLRKSISAMILSFMSFPSGDGFWIDRNHRFVSYINAFQINHSASAMFTL